MSTVLVKSRNQRYSTVSHARRPFLLMHTLRAHTFSPFITPAGLVDGGTRSASPPLPNDSSHERCSIVRDDVVPLICAARGEHAEAVRKRRRSWHSVHAVGGANVGGKSQFKSLATVFDQASFETLATDVAGDDIESRRSPKKKDSVHHHTYAPVCSHYRDHLRGQRVTAASHASLTMPSRSTLMVLVCAHLIGSAAAFAIGAGRHVPQSGRSFTRQFCVLQGQLPSQRTSQSRLLCLLELACSEVRSALEWHILSIHSKTKTQTSAGGSMPSNPFLLTRQIFLDEGIAGFYGGVSSTMLGQALIKGVLFLQYNAARNLFMRFQIVGTLSLVLAAASSGAVGSFVITPVERVKCVMQALPCRVVQRSDCMHPRAGRARWHVGPAFPRLGSDAYASFRRAPFTL